MVAEDMSRELHSEISKLNEELGRVRLCLAKIPEDLDARLRGLETKMAELAVKNSAWGQLVAIAAGLGALIWLAIKEIGR